MEKHKPLDDYRSWFFTEPVVAENDLKCIFQLSEEYASGYWMKNICSEQNLQIALNFRSNYDNEKKHLQIVKKINDIYLFKEANYNWFDDWNKDNIRGLSDFLSGNTNLSDDDKIMFFWGITLGLETTFGVFKRNWINFLYDDEWPILLCPRTGLSILFSPTGHLYLGYKNEPSVG